MIITGILKSQQDAFVAKGI